MQDWHYGKGLIYLMANILANKISLPQGQSYSEGKYYNDYNGSKNLNFKCDVDIFDVSEEIGLEFLRSTGINISLSLFSN